MNLSLSDNTVRFQFQGYDLLLLSTEPGVWRLLSAQDGDFDFNGAAQTIAADLGEAVPDARQPLQVLGSTVSTEQGDSVCIGANEICFTNCHGQRYRRLTRLFPLSDGIGVSFALGKQERLYGTGERFNRVNQRGKRIRLFAIDRWCQKEGNSYAPIPFVLSSDCNALFFNRYEQSGMDLGLFKKNQMTVHQKYAPLDLYIFSASKPADLLSAYCRLTGFSPMPCDWAFGTLVCRYHPEFGSKDGVLAMVDAMQENDFPWDAIIMEGWRTYESGRWDELKEISDIIHAKGKKLMVYEQCGRFPKPEYSEQLGLTDSHAVQSDKGTNLTETRSFNLLDNLSNHNMRCYDLTKSEALAKWREIWGRLIHEIGVDGAKIDFCEQFPDSADIRFADGRSPRGAHHWFPTLYNILSYRDFNTRPDGGLNFSRGTGIGGQRAPFLWAGDQRREFNFLGTVIKAALSLGCSGFPFVSWDMAGYRPSFLPYDRKKENEVFLRATEFTAFSPTVQTHGNVSRPYDFDTHTKDVYRAYMHLHDALRPYIKQQAEIACRTGLPMMRHLFLQFSADTSVLDVEDEYMFGDALLVAPILKNARKRDIILPHGEWENLLTGEVFEGGRTLKKFSVPLEWIPVFKNKNADTAVLDAALQSARPYIETIVQLGK